MLCITDTNYLKNDKICIYPVLHEVQRVQLIQALHAVQVDHSPHADQAVQEVQVVLRDQVVPADLVLHAERGDQVLLMYRADHGVQQDLGVLEVLVPHVDLVVLGLQRNLNKKFHAWLAKTFLIHFLVISFLQKYCCMARGRGLYFFNLLLKRHVKMS